MKLVIFALLLLASSTFVMAASSEAVMDFNIGNTVDVASEYTSSPSFWDVYGTWIAVLIIIIIIVALLKKNKSKKVVIRKASKKKPVGKKKPSKKKRK